jgi:hypothetical protein
MRVVCSLKIVYHSMKVVSKWYKVSPGGAKVEVHHVADAIAIEDGVDCVQRDREEGNSEGQTQLK